MSGLHLISTYSSDSDDDSGEIEEHTTISNSYMSHSLPLPSCIKSWKGVEHHQDVIDDPAEHDGRIRAFKHERGNWATLVYIDYTPSDALLSWLQFIVSQIPIKGNTLFEQFHISVTRTLVLKFHWIESFVDSLKTLCHRTDKFTLELSDMDVYVNEERTRTFLGMKCQSNNVLNDLSKKLNSLLSEYQLQHFYEDPSYHVSFFWSLGDNEASLRTTLPFLTDSLNKFLAEQAEENYIHVNALHCKIGNKLYIFQLR